MVSALLSSSRPITYLYVECCRYRKNSAPFMDDCGGIVVCISGSMVYGYIWVKEMALNGDQCLVLLIIGFIFALIFARALMAVVNRGFLLVNYAKAELSEIIPGAKGGGKFGVQDLVGGLMQAVMPALQAKFQGWLGVGQPPKAK